jgi:hypothetical protein
MARSLAKKPQNAPAKPERRTSKASPKSYWSAAFAAIHEAAERLHMAGMIDNTTMREFDRDCL